MKKKIVVLSVAAAITAAAGLSYAGGHGTRQAEEIFDFATGEPVRGGAVLTRSANEVVARLSMMDLDKKAAYSVWWVVFNNPAKCSAPGCGEDDIFLNDDLFGDQVNAAQISVFYADGFVTGTDGTANVYATLNSGLPPEGTFINFGYDPVGPVPPGTAGFTTDNGLVAEFHLVVRTHGKAVAGAVAEQTSTFTGLCGVQKCADQLAVVFTPPP